MKWRLLLALLLAAVLLGCAQETREEPRQHFLPLGSQVFLFLDLSVGFGLPAGEGEEWPFLCTQHPRGLVCQWTERPWFGEE